MNINQTQFNRDLFIDNLRATKPPGSIPTLHLYAKKTTEEDPSKMCVPLVGLRLIQMYEKNKESPWNEEQLNTLIEIKHFSHGFILGSFNSWRWISFHTQLLLTQIIKSMTASSKSSETLTLLINTQDLLTNGVSSIDVHLRELNESRGNYDIGKNQIIQANDTIKKIPINHILLPQIKERIQLLAKCVQQKDTLFPLLLLPLTMLEQKQVNDHGVLFVEVIDKMAIYFPSQAIELLTSFDMTFNKIHKQITMLDSSPRTVSLLESIKTILTYTSDFHSFWEQVAKKPQMPSFTTYKTLMKNTHLTIEITNDWINTIKQLYKEIMVDYNSYGTALTKFVPCLKDIISKTENLIDDSRKKNKSTEKHVIELEQTLNSFTSLRSLFDLLLRNNAQHFYNIVVSFINYQKEFWDIQEKNLTHYLSLFDLSPSKKALSIDRLGEIIFNDLALLEDQTHTLGILSQFQLALSKIRYYNEQHSSLSSYQKTDCIIHLITDLQKAKSLAPKNDNNYSKTVHFIETLENVLGKNNIYYSDMLFSFCKENLLHANEETLISTFYITLKVPFNYLHLEEDAKEIYTDPLKTLFPEKTGGALISPLIKKIEKFINKRSAIESELKKYLTNALQLKTIPIEDLKNISLFLIHFKELIDEMERDIFLEYNQVVEQLLPLVNSYKINQNDLDYLEKTTTACTQYLVHLNIFTPTYSLIQWGFFKSLEKQPLEFFKKITSPPEYTPPKPVTKTFEKTDLPVFKPIHLIDRVATAAKQEVVSLTAKEFLNNILIDLLPSLAEIIDKHIFSTRLFEKTKLLLEQSLKFSLVKKESASLFEKTLDLREQQLIASHSLPDLFEPIKVFFDSSTISSTLDYFSIPFEEKDDLRHFVAKALLASECLLTFSNKQTSDFTLTKKQSSHSLKLLIPIEMTELKNTLQKICNHLSKIKQRSFFIQAIGTDEDPFTMKRRQCFLLSNLKQIEIGLSRLQKAFNNVDEETPLAFSGEILHISASLLEHALLTLISYYGIKGDDGGHKILQKVSSQTQTRVFKYVHHLKILKDILQKYFKEHYPSITLFDNEMNEVIQTLQTYNNQTHRYLAQDKTPLGVAFKKLHEDTKWRTGVSQEFKVFREQYTDPILVKALKTTLKLLDALPFKSI